MDEDALGEFTRERNNLFVLERDSAVGKRKKSVVAALLDVFAGVKFGAALANDDLARSDAFAAEALDTESFGDGIASELS